MNTKAIALLSLAAAFLAATATEAKTENKNVEVAITFENSDRFTDIEMGAITTDSEKSYIMEQISKTFADNAKRYLPNGYSLKVKVSDIDLAGSIEPWRYRLEDVRIMKEIYPPRLKFSYTIRDANNEIVSDGIANLKDFNYLMNPMRLSHQNDPAFYVSVLVKDWLQGDVRRTLKLS